MLSAPLLLGAIWCMRHRLLPGIFEKPNDDEAEDEQHQHQPPPPPQQQTDEEDPHAADATLRVPPLRGVRMGTRATPGCGSGRADCSSRRAPGCGSSRPGSSRDRDRAAKGDAAAKSAALVGWKQRQPESTPPWLQMENAAAATAAARAGKLRTHGPAAGDGWDSPTKRTRERIQASIEAAKGAAARSTSPTKFERLQTTELMRFERLQADISLPARSQSVLPARSYPKDCRQRV